MSYKFITVVLFNIQYYSYNIKQQQHITNILI